MVGLDDSTTSALQRTQSAAIDAVQRASRCVPDLLSPISSSSTHSLMQGDLVYIPGGQTTRANNSAAMTDLPTATVPSVRPSYPSSTVLCGEEGGLGAVCLETLRLLQGDGATSSANKREMRSLLAQTAVQVAERWGGDASARKALASVLASEGQEESSERNRATAMALEGQSVSSKRKRKNGQVAEDEDDWDQVL